MRFLANLHEALRIALWSRIAMRLLWPARPRPRPTAPRASTTRRTSVPWEEHLDPDATFAVEATLRDSRAHPLRLRGAEDQGRAGGPAPRASRGGRPDVDTRRPGRPGGGAPGGDPALAVAGRRRRAAQPARLPGAAHGGAAEGDARRGHPPRRRLHRRGAAAGPDVRLGHASSSRRGSSPCAGRPACTGASASSAGPRSARRPRRSLDRHPRRGPRQRAPGARSPSVGFDRSSEAVEAARANVQAARLEREISIAEADATRPLPARGFDRGLLVTNPPYGDRLTPGGQKGMKTFYFHLGERLGALPGLPHGHPLRATRPSRRRSTTARCAGDRCGTGPSSARCSSTAAARPPARGAARPGAAAGRCCPGGSRASPPKSTEVSAAAAVEVPGTSQATATATTPASSEPTELMRRIAKHRRVGQRPCHAPPGARAPRATPSAVATPFPPRNPSQGGATCPAKAASPTAADTSRPRRRGRARAARAALPSARPGAAPARPGPCRPPGPRWWRRCCRCPASRTSTPRVDPDEEQPERDAPREVAEEHQARGDHRQPRRVWTMTKA